MAGILRFIFCKSEKKMEMLLDGENMFKNQKLCSRIAKKFPKYVLDCNYIINKNVITAIMHSKPAEKHKKNTFQ